MIEQINKYGIDMLVSLLETFKMVGISVVIGLIFGLIIGVLLVLTKKDGIYSNKYIYKVLDILVNITRSIPFILLAIILIPFTRFLIGKAYGTTASIVPLTVISIALFARFTETSINEVPNSIIQTGLAMGVNKFELIYYFMIKEAISSLILGYTSAIISIISYSTAMGIIGGGGIGDFAIYHGYTRNNIKLMFVVIIIMYILIQIIQITGNKLANKLDKKKVGV